MRKREDRISTLAPARVKHGQCWTDVTVRNVSRRGLMLQFRQPPARGTFIELRRGPCVVVGQVMWAEDDRCGLRTQDAIDITNFLAAQSTAEPWQAGKVERRSQPRARHADIALRSQLLARALQAAGTSAIVLVGIYLTAVTVHSALAAPMAHVTAALSDHQ